MADRNLPNEINQFYDALLERVALIKTQTQEHVSEIKEEQNKLAAELQEKLARGESLRKSDFAQMFSSLIAKRKNRQQEVMEILTRFQREEEEMVEGLKKLLGEGKKIRTKEFKRFLAECKKKEEERKENISEISLAVEEVKKEANEIIEKFTKEREEMRNQWEQLAATMRKKRASKPRR